MEEARRDPRLPDVPIAVVTGAVAGRGEQRVRRQVTEAHVRMAATAPEARHVVAERSGHYVPQDDPALVARVVLDVVDRVREDRVREDRVRGGPGPGGVRRVPAASILGRPHWAWTA